MSCERAGDWIQREIDGDLAPEAKTALDAHLRDCAPCRAERESLRELFGLVVELGATDRVVSPAPRSGAVSPWRPLAAAALLLIAVGLLARSVRVPPPDGGGDSLAGDDGTVEAALVRSAVSSAEPVLVVSLPSREPDVHIFWFYPDPAPNGAPGDRSADEVDEEKENPDDESQPRTTEERSS